MRKRKIAIDLDGRKHIVIENLAVFGGSIEMGRNASNNTIKGVTSYYGNSTSGVMDDYQTASHSIGISGDHNSIERCEIAYGAGTGVRIVNTRVHFEKPCVFISS